MAPVRSTGPCSMGTPRGEVLDHLVQRAGGDEAQIGAAGRGTVGFRLELLTSPVQIDLAVAGGQGHPARAEPHRLHAQDPGVELHGGVDIGYGQYQMVQAVGTHRPIVGPMP